MKIKFAWFLPVLVFYTENIKSNFAGLAAGPFIFIKEKYREDKGLLRHEIKHSKQFYITLGIGSLLYKFNAKVRYLAEVGCYKEQLKFSPDSKKKRHAEIYADFIINRYGLKNLDKASVIKDIQAKPKYWLWG